MTEFSLSLQDYPVWLRLGWHKTEREVPQEVRLWMWVRYGAEGFAHNPQSMSGEGVELSQVLDYAQLVEVIKGHAEGGCYRLVEEYLHELVEEVATRFVRIHFIRVEVQKTRIPGFIQIGSSIKIALEREFLQGRGENR